MVKTQKTPLTDVFFFLFGFSLLTVVFSSSYFPSSAAPPHSTLFLSSLPLLLPFLIFLSLEQRVFPHLSHLIFLFRHLNIHGIVLFWIFKSQLTCRVWIINDHYFLPYTFLIIKIYKSENKVARFSLSVCFVCHFDRLFNNSSGTLPFICQQSFLLPQNQGVCVWLCVRLCVRACWLSWINELVKERWRGRSRQVLLSCSKLPDPAQRQVCRNTHSHGGKHVNAVSLKHESVLHHRQYRDEPDSEMGI